MREVFRNPSFRLLFGGVLIFFTGQGLTNALALDANSYFWSLDVKQIQAIAMSLVGGFVFVPCSLPGRSRYGHYLPVAPRVQLSGYRTLAQPAFMCTAMGLLLIALPSKAATRQFDTRLG